MFAENISYSETKKQQLQKYFSFLCEKQNFYQKLELVILIANLLPTSLFFHPMQ